MINIDKSYVGKIIKQKRKEAGLKQAELAEIIGISEKHLSKIETGKNYPALDNFLKMAEILKFSLNDFGSEEVKNTKLSPQKEKLKMIINIASEKQIKIYLDLINLINNHIK